MGHSFNQHKKHFASKEILDGIKPYFVEKENAWVIQLQEHRFLHWIESTDWVPVTVGRPEFSMQKYNFKGEAQALCDYLRKLWSEQRDPDFDPNAKLHWELDVDAEQKAREEWRNK